MSGFFDNFDIISQMVDETFGNLESEQSSIQEQNCFHERKLTSNAGLSYFREPKQLEFYFNFFLGAYDELRKCYIFQISDHVIEFPDNWGPFKLTSFREGEIEEIFSLNKFEDIDYFFEIMETLTSKNLKLLACQNCGTHLKLVYEVDEEQRMAEVIQIADIDFSDAA